MKKLVSIRENKDFKRAYVKGRSLVSPFVVLYINKNFKKGLRVGIVASKKIGNAVERNRARRLIKAASFGLLLGLGSLNVDFVLVARSRILSVKSYVVKKHLESWFKEFRQV